MRREGTQPRGDSMGQSNRTQVGVGQQDGYSYRAARKSASDMDWVKVLTIKQS